MLRKLPWLTPDACIEFALIQAQDEGLDVAHLVNAFNEVQNLQEETPEKRVAAVKLYEELALCKPISSYDYEEPSEINEIFALGCPPKKEKNIPSKAEMYNKVYGAWLARCAGCLLGQPVEGWHRERINALCRETKNYPVNHYISSDVSKEITDKYGMVNMLSCANNRPVNWINNVAFMPEDDDTNYTVLSLKLLETYGTGFTSDDVAECWLDNLPILHTCTAERFAYRNLVCGVFPPQSAGYQNPCCEWIGAQIRTDLYGYINPGDIKAAAEMAYRDASISHTKNGIYGAIFTASMLSHAAVCSDIEQIINAALNIIPPKSRFVESIKHILEMYAEKKSIYETADYVHSIYNEKLEHHWCHTIPNAMIVVASLLYGNCDLEKTFAYSLMCAFDTDCNCATAGSVVGMVCGANKLDTKWTDPLCDTLLSGVDGFGKVKISNLAARTVKFIEF